jgi:transposase
MWLLGRLRPDHKSIAEFRRLHRDAVVETGAELIAFARSVGLVRGEWIAIDGSKFRAVSSANSVHERLALERYLERMESADGEEEPVIDPSAVASALEKLRQHPEPEVGFMHTAQGQVPAYNVQTAVDAEHGLIVVQKVTDEANDTRSLLPMAEAAQAAVGDGQSALKVIADAGYSNGEQASACEAKGIIPHLPANRGKNHKGDGTLFDRTQFEYQQETDTMLCPAGHHLRRDCRKGRSIVYAGRPEICGACPLKSQCTVSRRRLVKRHLHDAALQRMNARATAAVMQLRGSIVEHPFATIKYHIFGHPRFLLRGLRGAQTEMGLAVMVYNFKRMLKVLGGTTLRLALATG